MRKKGMMLLLLSCIVLSGCSQASQVENHAYVLVMGMDMLEEEQIQMTVLVPKISGSTASSDSSYTSFSVEAKNYETALAKLNWASPRDLTLSQIKLIVLSHKLAEDERCRELIENIAQTERLYTAAHVVVCEGDAGEFVKAIQPTIGTRISEDIEAMYEHYTGSGYVPQSSLAELFYQTESIYSDPMVTYALLYKEAEGKKENNRKENNDQAKPASALSAGLAQLSEDYQSDIATRYLGAAVFSGGRLSGVFSGEECIMASLIRNETEAIQYEFDGQTLNMVPARAVLVKVDPRDEQLYIKINAHLAVAAQERRPDEEKLRKSLENDIRETISAAQAMNSEPFGFAQKAAKHFLTIDQWLDYDWIAQFKDAQIEIEVHLARSDA